MLRPAIPRPKLIAIVGPTASGKTALAIEIARALAPLRFEAINADSRQVYRFMDIGTAKPTAEERQALPHHLIDVIYPDEHFSLATWLDMANEALTSTWGAGHTPVVVGGTGQYVWALLEGWRVPKVPPQEELRRELEGRPPEELLAKLQEVDPESHEYVQPANVRRVIRALEVYYATGKPFSFWRTKDPPHFDWLALGLSLTRDELYAHIDARVDAMMETGFLEEVRRLLEVGYSRDLPAMSSLGYDLLSAHLAGEMTLAEAVKRTKTGTHRFSRHQNAWFKRTDERVRWVESPAEAVAAASEFLTSAHPEEPKERHGGRGV